jgi:hypothetical protein
MGKNDSNDAAEQGRKKAKKVVAGAGIEPATQGFSVLCSTD